MDRSDVRKAYADTRHGQVHYRWVAGPGVPLVMYHRAPATSASFGPMMERMAGERGLYAFDLPGFGMSFAPDGTPTVADYAGWLLESLDALGLDRFHIFAHHTGTHFATEMAAAHPDRVASLMLNGIAYLTAEERAKLVADIRATAIPDPDGAYMADAFKIMASLLPEFDARLFHEEMTGIFLAHYSLNKSFGAIWRQDYPATLAKVKCPILATCAENEAWRFCFERIFADRPDAKRAVLGPAKFFTPELDAVATVAVIRRFLDGIENGRAADNRPDASGRPSDERAPLYQSADWD